MGCCESCFKQKDDEVNERSPLLQGEGTSTIDIGYPNGADIPIEGAPPGSMPHHKRDEQQLLNDILTKYSTDMVDVMTMDSRIDAVEYMNRVTLYNRKLASMTSRLEIRKPSLRSACTNPFALLNAPAPPSDSLAMADEICREVAQAMKDVRVVKKQDLTVDLAQR